MPELPSAVPMSDAEFLFQDLPWDLLQLEPFYEPKLFEDSGDLLRELLLLPSPWLLVLGERAARLAPLPLSRVQLPPAGM